LDNIEEKIIEPRILIANFNGNKLSVSLLTSISGATAMKAALQIYMYMYNVFKMYILMGLVTNSLVFVGTFC